MTATDEPGQGFTNRVETRYNGTTVGPLEAEVAVIPRITLSIYPCRQNLELGPFPSSSLLAFDSKQTDNYKRSMSSSPMALACRM